MPAPRPPRPAPAAARPRRRRLVLGQAADDRLAREDPEQAAVLDDRQALEALLGHQVERVAERRLGAHGRHVPVGDVADGVRAQVAGIRDRGNDRLLRDDADEPLAVGDEHALHVRLRKECRGCLDRVSRLEDGRVGD
jgi:hypothetical protein